MCIYLCKHIRNYNDCVLNLLMISSSKRKRTNRESKDGIIRYSCPRSRRMDDL